MDRQRRFSLSLIGEFFAKKILVIVLGVLVIPTAVIRFLAISPAVPIAGSAFAARLGTTANGSAAVLALEVIRYRFSTFLHKHLPIRVSVRLTVSSKTNGWRLPAPLSTLGRRYQVS